MKQKGNKLFHLRPCQNPGIMIRRPLTSIGITDEDRELMVKAMKKARDAKNKAAGKAVPEDADERQPDASAPTQSLPVATTIPTPSPSSWGSQENVPN
ncbi:hypothetical protein QR680_018692 [Steinernema hermaphroditum]|uniref:Uncharacterized protein n=1 Tax=Steinernema hermaphroditum TaxID=289476 RepID=A0AA39HK07_9BILA|nr:hypothetical protein QR680_018692 [Steinernema hermaphroditum]